MRETATNLPVGEFIRASRQKNIKCNNRYRNCKFFSLTYNTAHKHLIFSDKPNTISHSDKGKKRSVKVNFTIPTEYLEPGEPDTSLTIHVTVVKKKTLVFKDSTSYIVQAPPPPTTSTPATTTVPEE